jgi:hypothetical protein
VTIAAYAEVLAPQLGHGFVIGELVKPGQRRFTLPPRSYWARMLRPLQLANELRAVMVKDHGARGLRVNAAFRPTGGAANSQHKWNRALDLDLLTSDRHLTKAYYEEAVRMWCEYGHNEPIGLGLYCRGDVCAGIRVHIDAGGYMRSRHWQHGLHAGKADQLIIAERLGLHAPGQPAPVDDEGSDDELELGA